MRFILLTGGVRVENPDNESDDNPTEEDSHLHLSTPLVQLFISNKEDEEKLLLRDFFFFFLRSQSL